MHKSYFNLPYLRTPMGAVKVVNVVFGAISLILVGASYVPLWTLSVFIGTVGFCLLLSLLYLTFYLLASSSAIHCKANRVTSFLFHVLAGTALIVAGIELIGWSEYTDPNCKHDCPRLYTVGIAKTLTFMNGTLYLIVGFLGVKDDDLLDPDAAEEDIPLLTSSTKLTSIPGKVLGSSFSSPSSAYYFDPFLRHSKLPPHSDDIRSNYIYRLHRPSSYNHNNVATAEYSFNNSCTPAPAVPPNSYSAATTMSTYGGMRIPVGSLGGGHFHHPQYNFNEKRMSGSSVNGSVKNIQPHSLPAGNNLTELHFIKE